MPSRFEYERAIRASDLPPLSRLVALTLATWADVATGDIPERLTPSLTTLEVSTGMARASVRKHLDKLEADGWILRRRPDVRRARSEKTRTRYFLAVSTRAADALADDLQTPPLGQHAPQSESGLGQEAPQARAGAALALGQELTPARAPAALKSSPPSEEYQGSTSTVLARDDDPEWIRPLQEAMSARGINLPWKFIGDDLIRLHNDVKRLGVPLMVDHAESKLANAPRGAFSSRFFYDDWHRIKTPVPSGQSRLSVVSGPESTADKRLRQGTNLIDLYRRQEAGEGSS